MKFAEYLKRKKIRQEDAAEQLETTQATISRWVKGENIPRPEQMAKIKLWSKGWVKITDFYEREN